MSDLVGNPEDWFSRVEAHMNQGLFVQSAPGEMKMMYEVIIIMFYILLECDGMLFLFCFFLFFFFFFFSIYLFIYLLRSLHG